MEITFRSIRMHLRFIAATVTALAAAAGAAAALTAYSDYVPATRGFAKEVAKTEVNGALLETTARIGTLQRESGETRLQLNQLRLETLRNAKWKRTEQLKIAPDLPTRELIQQQLDQIEDDLNDVKAERGRLRIPSP
jgi:hypothetical protein